jgi:hypothetical protein
LQVRTLNDLASIFRALQHALPTRFASAWRPLCEVRILYAKFAYSHKPEVP